MKTYDQFDSHIERCGYVYIYLIIALQIVLYILNCLLPPIIEPNLSSTSYQIYNLIMLSFLLFAKLYFLTFAVTTKSPSDLFSFLILSAVFTCYMVFRNIMFIKYPSFYMVRTEKSMDNEEPQLNKRDPLKYW